MKLEVAPKAALWYKEELQLQDQTDLRLFVRFGDGGIIPGFSLGIQLAEPNQPLVKEEIESIHFFIESSDEWYFENHNLQIIYDEKREEPKFKYISKKA